MAWFKKRDGKREPGLGFLIVAGSLIGVSLSSLFDGDPAARLSFLFMIIGVMLCVTCYMWKEIGHLYPPEQQKKKKIILIISALTAVAIQPLATILLSAQLIKFYKIRKAEQGYITPVNRKDEPMANYVMSISILIIATALFLYSNYIHNFRTEQPSINIEASAP